MFPRGVVNHRRIALESKTWPRQANCQELSSMNVYDVMFPSWLTSPDRFGGWMYIQIWGDWTGHGVRDPCEEDDVMSSPSPRSVYIDGTINTHDLSIATHLAEVFGSLVPCDSLTTLAVCLRPHYIIVVSGC